MGTFGRTTVGANDFNTHLGNEKYVSKFTLTEAADVSKLTAYVGGVSAAARGVIYADSGGAPGALLGESAATSHNTTPQWRDYAFAAPVRLAPGDYWLGLHFSAAMVGGDFYNGDEASLGRKNTDTYTDGAADPFGTPTTINGEFSVYATYELADTTPPDGAWINPAVENEIMSATETLEVTATDAGPLGMGGVQFKADGTNIGTEDTTSPYQASWNTTLIEDGPYTLTAVLRDAVGNTRTLTRTVTVRNRVDQAFPEGRIRAPAAGTLDGTVTVRVGCYDDRLLQSVQLMVDGGVTGPVLTANLDSRAKNGHFEINANDWSLVATATIGRVTSQFKYEAASLQVVCAATGDGARNTGALAWTAGHYHECTVWVKGTAAQTVKARVVKGAGNTLVGAEQPLTLDGTWQKINWEVLAATTEAHKIEMLSTSGAQTFYLDGAAAVRQTTISWQTAELTNGAHTVGARIVDVQGNTVDTATVAVTLANPSLVIPKLLVEVAFDSDPADDPQTWTDVTEWLAPGDVIAGHGRDDELGRAEAGRASLRLKNHDRRFDKTNPTGPYYGKIGPGRRLRVSAVYGNTTVRLHEGTTTVWEAVWLSSTRSYVLVQSVDDFEPLSAGRVSTPKATLTTALTGTNNDLVFTSRVGGGDDISIEYVADGAASTFAKADASTRVAWSSAPRWAAEPQAVSSGLIMAAAPPTLQVSGRQITVTLAHTAGVVTTTAAQVKAAIEANPAANEIVAVANAASNDGTGTVTAMSAAFLSGGTRGQEYDGTRIGWVLDQLAHPAGRRELDVGAFQAQAVQMERQQGLQHVKDVAASDLGVFFMDGRGYAVFHDRNRRLNATVKTGFSSNPSYAAGQHLCLPSSQIDDWTKVRNDISVTAAGLPPATTEDTASQGAYWKRSYDHATLLPTAADLTTRAALLLADYKDQRPRIETLVLDPQRETQIAASTSAWPVALSMEVSDKVSVDIVPPGGGTSSFECFVERVQHRISVGAVRRWHVILGLSIAVASSSGGGVPGGGGAPGNWLLDDPVESLLGTTTRLA